MALDFFVHIPWFGGGLSHGFRYRSSQGQGCNLIGVDWLMSLYLLVAVVDTAWAYIEYSYSEI